MQTRVYVLFSPHLPVVNKFLRFWPSQTDWNWLKLTEAGWNRLKLIENDSELIEMDESRRENHQNLASWLRMEGGAKTHQTEFSQS